jgi:hypothetical protein
MTHQDAAPLAVEETVRAEAEDAAPGGGGPEIEIEHQGQVYRIAAALRSGFLRQADYTRKTQDLATQRRALAADREAFEGRIEAMWSSVGELVLWVALNRNNPWAEDSQTPPS